MNVTIKIASQNADKTEEEMAGNADWCSASRVQDRVNPQHDQRNRLDASSSFSCGIRHGAKSTSAASVSRHSAFSLRFLRYVRRRVSPNASASKRFRRFL